MRKLIASTLLTAVVLFQSCSVQPGSPKATVNSFLNAMKSGDIKEVKKYITKSDIQTIELGETMARSIGQEEKMVERMQGEFKEMAKNVTYEVKDEKITGDDATVNIAVTENGKTETHAFDLKKENGEWKVNLISTTMKRAGLSEEDMQKEKENLKETLEEIKKMNGDSLSEMLKKTREELKKINVDSLSEKIKEGGKGLEKMAEELKKIKTN